MLYKPPGEDGGLYTLVTDQVFLHEPSVVWERLEDVEGSSSSFVDSDFVRSSPAGGDYAGHTAETALKALEAQARALSLEESAEYAATPWFVDTHSLLVPFIHVARISRGSFRKRKMLVLARSTREENRSGWNANGRSSLVLR